MTQLLTSCSYHCPVHRLCNLGKADKCGRPLCGGHGGWRDYMAALRSTHQQRGEHLQSLYRTLPEIGSSCDILNRSAPHHPSSIPALASYD